MDLLHTEVNMEVCKADLVINKLWDKVEDMVNHMTTKYNNSKYNNIMETIPTPTKVIRVISRVDTPRTVVVVVAVEATEAETITTIIITTTITTNIKVVTTLKDIRLMEASPTIWDTTTLINAEDMDLVDTWIHPTCKTLEDTSQEEDLTKKTANKWEKENPREETTVTTSEEIPMFNNTNRAVSLNSLEDYKDLEPLVAVVTIMEVMDLVPTNTGAEVLFKRKKRVEYFSRLFEIPGTLNLRVPLHHKKQVVF
mmetsp:Transcript_24228/g.27666  ORF Transcript_24228/g.27666 Transcript_24228/m.27666 type:complete len:254 (-) Transcript_24228:37-798(-)